MAHKPTIREVAALAGVSTATVSHVLNQSKKITPEIARRVIAATKELDYQPHIAATNMRRKHTNNVMIVMPALLDSNFTDIFLGIEKKLIDNGYLPSIHITSEIAETENKFLDLAANQKAAGIIIATCQPESGELDKCIASFASRAVFVEREPGREGCAFIEHDNNAAIVHAVDTLPPTAGRFMAVCGPLHYSCEKKAVRAFEKAVRKKYGSGAAIEYVETNFDKESAFKLFTRKLQEGFRPDAVFSTSECLHDGVQKAVSLQGKAIGWPMEFVVLGTASWAAVERPGTLVIARRSLELGGIAAEMLLDSMRNPAAHAGQYKKMATRPERPVPAAWGNAKARRTLNVLLMESSALKATKALLPHFTQYFNADVRIDSCPFDIYYDRLLESLDAGRHDIVQIDQPWMRELAADGQLVRLDPLMKRFPGIDDAFLPGVMDAYARWDNAYYAFPYWFDVQLLFYRADAFADADLQYMYQDMCGGLLKPPGTWKEFNAVARFFNREHNPKSPLRYGTTIGADHPNGAVCEFLPRFWAFGGNEMDENGAFAIDCREGVAALENYVDAFAFSAPGKPGQYWERQVENFARGDVATMCLFISHATMIADRGTSNIVGRAGFDILPGGASLLGGWALGIGAKCDDPETAFGFIRWATCDELSIPHTILGGASPSAEFYRNPEILHLYPWIPKIPESFATSRARRVISSATNGKIHERQYENILGSWVNRAVRGELSPADALRLAQDELNSLL